MSYYRMCTEGAVPFTSISKGLVPRTMYSSLCRPGSGEISSNENVLFSRDKLLMGVVGCEPDSGILFHWTQDQG